MESNFWTHKEPLPDVSNYFDCGSVRISVTDCGDLIDTAAELEPDVSLPLYTRYFNSGELGKVSATGLNLRSDMDGNSFISATLRHSHRVEKPTVFSTQFISQLIRRHAIAGDAITKVHRNQMYDVTELISLGASVTIHSAKGPTSSGDPRKASNQGNVIMSMPIGERTTPEQIAEYMRLWGDALDILSTFPLAKRRSFSESITIDIKRLSFTEDTLDLMLMLEAYNNQAGEAAVPDIDYSQLDLRQLSREVAGDYEAFSSALAITALAARRTYGKTGIVPPLTNQSLADAMQSVRPGQETQ